MAEQDFERDFWGDCLNTYDEESKHYTYARLMGIPVERFAFVSEATVLDIGGGPVSMLLKAPRPAGRAFLDSGRTVLDPLLPAFPEWVHERYACAAIETLPIRGEDLTAEKAFDEVWIYNVLQHVDDPERVVANARRAADTVRIFEWAGIPAYEGHPHELLPALLDEWLGGTGRVVGLNENGAVGTAYAGAFPA